MWLCRTRASLPGGAGAGAGLMGAPGSRAADRQEVQRAREVAVATQREVRLGDGGGEPVVEALGDPQARVDGVPREVVQREAVDGELAGVEEAEDLDVLEVRLAERA